MYKYQLKAKKTIINNSIEDDQKVVAQQWLNTFKYNPSGDVATNMSQLLLACVARGDFKTRSSLVKNKELTNPGNVLTSIDYLSHASRVIVDYQMLSEENRKEFLSFFPKKGTNGVVSRSATHAVVRKGEKVTELKGFMLGVVGQIPTFFKDPYDFGVNIAMGGEGQKNLVGKYISKNGFSGHMYFHHYGPHGLMMMGLEQSAPSSSLREVVWGHAPEDENIQSNTDQFGQGHSLTGASDTFTAAGSLYFSDPVYQAKLLTEKGTVAPDKYGAMQVTLNDDNWPEIKEYLRALKSNIERDDQLALEQMMLPPSTAVEKDMEIENYIALDFKTYLKNIRPLLEDADPSVRNFQMNLQSRLLLSIETLKKGYTVEGFEQFLNLLNESVMHNGTPEAYNNALLRIGTLFELQLKIDPKLKQTNDNLIVKQRCNELVLAINSLEQKAKLMHKLLSSESLRENQVVSEYMESLSLNMDMMRHCREVLNIGILTEEIQGNKKISLEDSLIVQENLEPNWLQLKSLTSTELNDYESMINDIDLFLHECPVDIESMLKVAVIDDYMIANENHASLESAPVKDDLTNFIEAIQSYCQKRLEQPEIGYLKSFFAWSQTQKLTAAKVLIDILQTIKDNETITEEQKNKLAIHQKCLMEGSLATTTETHLNNLGLERLEQLVEPTQLENDLFAVPEITENDLATVNNIQPF